MAAHAPFESVEEAAKLFLVVESAKKEWETTFDAFADGIGILRKDGTFKRVNSALASMVGMDVRELPGKSCCEVFPHHQANGCPARLTSGHRQVEFEALAPWRRVYRESAYAVPGLDSVVVIVTDITQQRLAEERIKRLHEEAVATNRELVASMRRLKETQERLVATEKLASLATMAAGLAHEVNNPLGFVSSGFGHLRTWTERLLAFVETFQRGAVKSDLDRAIKEGGLADAGSEIAATMSDVQQGLDRIRRIVTAFSTFVEQGPVVLTQVDLNAIVREIVDEVEDQIREGATLVTSLGEVPPLTAAEAGLRTVLRQVLENAAFALKDTTRPGRVVVGTQVRGGRAVITVQDNGVGMPPDVLGRALDPFFTTRAPGPHVGLGLTVAQSIVRRHGGEMTLRSETGAGTTVEITLPMLTDPGSEWDPARSPASAQGKAASRT